MKKLMFALACAVAFAASAGEDAGAFNSTGFEKHAVGAKVANTDDNGGTGGDILWQASGTSDESAVQSYDADDARTFDYSGDVPKLFQGETSNQYLELNTSGDTLSRLLQANGTAKTLDSDVYIDTMVQFTATTDDPNLETDFDKAKLGLWLKENEATDGGESSYTLKVCASAVDFSADDEGLVQRSTIFTLSADGVSVLPNTWHRLTVKAIPSLTKASGVDYIGFEIRIDGIPVKANAGAFTDGAINHVTNDIDSATLNPSEDAELIASLQNGTIVVSLGQRVQSPTLTRVDFSGSGAIDDFVATTTDPFATGTSTYDFTLTWTVGLSAVSYTIGGTTTALDVAAGEVGSTTFTVAEGAVVTVAAEADANNWYKITSGTGATTVTAATTVDVRAAKDADAGLVTEDATAASLGITEGAFSGDTSTATLSKVVAWAEANGKTVADVKAMTFTAPASYTQTELAYLLGVADTEEAVAAATETAEEAIAIESITQKENGEWVVVSKAGETYLNGAVEIWSSTDLKGTYSKTGADDADGEAFYKAVLVFTK